MVVTINDKFDVLNPHANFHHFKNYPFCNWRVIIVSPGTITTTPNPPKKRCISYKNAKIKLVDTNSIMI